MVDVNWNRLAYAQMVRSHEELCSAVMVFGELYRTRSPAHRVLLFPRSWAIDKAAPGEEEEPEVYTTRRLLRKAARKFRVVLVPMGPLNANMDGEHAEPELEVLSGN